MAGMAAGILSSAEGRKQYGLMVAGVLKQPRDEVGNRECLKNISFAHPHWRTPSNGFGLWCSQVASPKSPLSKSFCGLVDLRNLPHHNPSCKPHKSHDLDSCELCK
ncbi:hypothetical protein L3X38_042625 [Prunus dulcis]|uniref:Uncharacterized protein n=1 Tax=Prunus dulcis TaxID=3755 RepID=A0AAD4YLQ3_PRUDU|nr:hypothetical protein L3X38_042625 [Prunus dulcis]